MNTRRWTEAKALLCCGVLGLACKDDDPCDPGQEERGVNACYSANAGSPATAGRAGSAGESDADSGAGLPGTEFEIGQPCADSLASSDCGGVAPICVPLPSGSVCTQALCLDSEVNAGACPAGWPCTEIPGFPSACLNL